MMEVSTNPEKVKRKKESCENKYKCMEFLELIMILEKKLRQQILETMHFLNKTVHKDP